MAIRKVGVVGLGTMGAGIAQVSVQAGYETVGREMSTELAERGRGTIEHYLGRAVEKERMTGGERDAAVAQTLVQEFPRPRLVSKPTSAGKPSENHRGQFQPGCR